MAKNTETLTVTLRDGTRLALPKPDASYVGEILRAAIIESGISQFALSKASGVAQAAISQFVNGAGLNLESVSRLVTALGLELTENPELAPKRIEGEK